MSGSKMRNPGSRGVGNTWLGSYFGDSRAFSHNYFECELGCSVSTFKRIISGNKLLREDIELAGKLAEAVQRDGKDNQKSLPLEDLIQALCRSQESDLREKAHDKAKRQLVDAARIKEALLACQYPGLEILVQGWCKRINGDIDALAQSLAGHIQSDAVRQIIRIIDDPLEAWIDTIQLSTEQKHTSAQLRLLKEFIGTIAVSCAVPCQVTHLEPGEGIQVFGVDKDWSIRLVIDAALGYPLTQVYPAKHRPRVHERYASELEWPESPSAEAQARQVMQQAGDDCFIEYTVRDKLMQFDNASRFSEEDPRMPEPGTDGYEQKMQLYCKDYNDSVLFANNYSRHHRFLYTTSEFPRAVRERLHALGITQLRIVESLQQSELPPSLRVEHGELSGWLNKCLTKIEDANQSTADKRDLLEPNTVTYINADQIGSIGSGNTVQVEK